MSMNNVNPPDGGDGRTKFLGVRVRPAAMQALDERADSELRSRADTARLLLAYALANMPKGWTP